MAQQEQLITTDYLELARRKLSRESGKSTNYALAKQLGISQQSMSRYMNGKGAMDDKAAVKVAKYLNIQEIILIAAVNAEQANLDADKQFWTALIHEKLEHAALDEKKQAYAKTLQIQRVASELGK